MIKRRLKSVTAPRRKKKVMVDLKVRQKKLAAKKRYLKNRSKILKAAKVRRKKRTVAEKAFDKKRAAFLRKTRPAGTKRKK